MNETRSQEAIEQSVSLFHVGFHLSESLSDYHFQLVVLGESFLKHHEVFRYRLFLSKPTDNRDSDAIVTFTVALVFTLHYLNVITYFH